jgi:hypothetical protein
LPRVLVRLLLLLAGAAVLVLVAPSRRAEAAEPIGVVGSVGATVQRATAPAREAARVVGRTVPATTRPVAAGRVARLVGSTVRRARDGDHPATGPVAGLVGPAVGPVAGLVGPGASLTGPVVALAGAAGSAVAAPTGPLAGSLSAGGLMPVPPAGWLRPAEKSRLPLLGWPAGTHAASAAGGAAAKPAVRELALGQREAAAAPGAGPVGVAPSGAAVLRAGQGAGSGLAALTAALLLVGWRRLGLIRPGGRGLRSRAEQPLVFPA